MTASMESLANAIGELVQKMDGHFYPDPAPGVLDFEMDGGIFRIIVLDDAEHIAEVQVLRERDATPDEEAALAAIQDEGGPVVDEELAAAIIAAEDEGMALAPTFRDDDSKEEADA